MIIGKRVTYTLSFSQQLSTKSSRDAKLLVVDKSMGQVLWTRHLLVAQGKQVAKTIIYKNTFLLADNGKYQVGTQHLNVHYFL